MTRPQHTGTQTFEDCSGLICHLPAQGQVAGLYMENRSAALHQRSLPLISGRQELAVPNRPLVCVVPAQPYVFAVI